MLGLRQSVDMLEGGFGTKRISASFEDLSYMGLTARYEVSPLLDGLS